MALVSPINIAALHQAGSSQTHALQMGSSKRYPDAWEKSEEPVIPGPGLFENLPQGNQGPEALPTPSECAVHLEMLEVFHALRNEVIQSQDLDRSFNIKPKNKVVYRPKREGARYVAEPLSLKDGTFERRRKAKWTYYLELAVTRFHIWIAQIDMHLGESKSSSKQLPQLFLLPPLDVLVVWHAFLLNCSDFKEYCNKRKLEHIQEIAFPWSEIHDAIDSRNWRYTLPATHAQWLLTVGGIHPDLLDAIVRAELKSNVAKRLLTKFSTSFFNRNNTNTLNFNHDNAGDRMAAFAGMVSTAAADQKENRPLVENVERQCVFVDKMHAHRWIRSPAVEGTMRRAVDRYDKFLHLFHLYPYRFLVPTLDIDLVWHTHQCSADHYRQFVTTRAGRFINHEDKISRGTLDHGFTNTEDFYRLSFGEQYQVCLCWSCEAILSAVEEREEEDILDTTTPDVSDLAKSVDKKVHYYQEVEVCRRMGRRLPIWTQDAGTVM
ncbi:hypothetical protein ARAM_003069 [Aspergillus rambellii]|uniref:Uncharacterized protein n=2 Tax=Aspergillus subgen. Nidulantes TaxID=2720870 RepID=A0A0F8WYU6_9EURO|nr:hypothetical protein AOCH_000052 [Aspergillus ochraceoroseus]KKK16527.1 hypothetical protein ARAM_003069 [Aspergillus rambellii]